MRMEYKGLKKTPIYNLKGDIIAYRLSLSGKKEGNPFTETLLASDLLLTEGYKRVGRGKRLILGFPLEGLLRKVHLQVLDLSKVLLEVFSAGSRSIPSIALKRIEGNLEYLKQSGGRIIWRFSDNCRKEFIRYIEKYASGISVDTNDLRLLEKSVLSKEEEEKATRLRRLLKKKPCLAIGVKNGKDISLVKKYCHTYKGTTTEIKIKESFGIPIGVVDELLKTIEKGKWEEFIRRVKHCPMVVYRLLRYARNHERVSGETIEEILKELGENRLKTIYLL
jgi:histone H3/H4